MFVVLSASVGGVLLALLITGFAAAFVLRARYGRDPDPNHVAVLVLGDLARSPRTLAHALSLAAHGFTVSLIGYPGAALPPAIAAHPRLRVVTIAATRGIGTSLGAARPTSAPMPRVGVSRQLRTGIRKVVCDTWRLVAAVLTLGDDRRSTTPSCLLVQNPPAVPTLAVAALLAWILRARVVVDWHNFAYSLLALKLDMPSLLRAMQFYEQLAGDQATAHLCVSHAMAEELEERWGLHGPITAFHDRPRPAFIPLPDAEQRAFLEGFAPDLAQRRYAPQPRITEEVVDAAANTRTVTYPASHDPRAHAPLLLVSSTSWTADEDFDALLLAMRIYDDEATPPRAEPISRLLEMVITGRGPLKAHYERLIHAHPWRFIHLRTAWLDDDDYPRLLASADVGISLHKSSSGLDLPMKIVDLFGAGTPVLAWAYPTLENEMVRAGVNGATFTDADTLAAHLLRLAQVGAADHELATWRRGAREFGATRWEETWASKVLPVFHDIKAKAAVETAARAAAAATATAASSAASVSDRGPDKKEL
ncbi:hypothetical protein CXG81DRAFT_10519 [Caulochytrium protostelioides]|uniref:Chitobiosyldiphosphodolichol beta-mannosyltransferase n=1 Tax=Caulochytrium protostelioides TaxID=1555241 RepID=A0A4P9XB63_9FUNG|nr:hypothetical protein CXG81DRAFT_10519 [Caulochytrium protostelioides]|eukprot:RKP02644.1 hypothetical protein CXG81DRAFT_10519 [Caulochytrium protostelioides]